MSLSNHSIWKNISPFKRPIHKIRIFLAQKAARFYPRSTFIGITGSVGKTSTTQACFEVLSQKYATLATIPDLDSILNIPITILKIRPKIKKVLLEMGAQYPGDMDINLSMVAPGCAILTRIFFAHSQFLGDIENILAEKIKLFKQLPRDGFAILNWDDLMVRKVANLTDAQVIFYGLDPKNCHVWAGNIRIINFKTKFELNYGVERAEVEYQLLGTHQIYSALAAAALGISCGMSLSQIKKGLEQVQPAPHRLNVNLGINGAYILDDTYSNASPIGLEAALNLLSELPARKRIAVIGEMRELGVYSEKLHKKIAQKIIQERLDLVLLGGGDAQFIASELENLGFNPDRLKSNLSNSQMVAEVLKYCGKGDVVLIKGSHSLRLDEVVKRLTKK